VRKGDDEKGGLGIDWLGWFVRQRPNGREQSERPPFSPTFFEEPSRNERSE